MANQPYEIHVKGHIRHDWADFLENMHLYCLENGEMILSGSLADQAALMGILNKLHYLHLAILSVNKKDRKDTGQAESEETASHSDC